MARNVKAGESSPADLVLSTIVADPPQYVAIDGSRFRMLRAQEFGLIEAYRISKMQERFAGLNGGEMTEEKLKHCSGLLVQMIELILPDVPAATRAKLTEMQRMAVVDHFNKAASAARPTSRKMRRAMKTKRRSSRSRRGSNASTAGTIPSDG